MYRSAVCLAVLGVLALPASAVQARPARARTAAGPDASRKPDLADAVAGQYSGSVVSDSRGSSRDGVGFTVTRVGRDLVSVSSDDPRFPTVTIPIEKALSSIVQRRGDNAFVIDTAKDPRHLDLTIDGARWVGDRSD